MSASEDDAQSTTPASILDRLVAAGISEGRARSWIAQGSVRVAGEPVNDASAPVPWPVAYTLNSA